MAERETYSVLFYPRNDKKNKKKGTPIYMRITVNGKRSELATGRYLKDLKWNSSAGQPRGNSEDAKKLKHFLTLLENKVNDAQKAIIEDGEKISALSLRNKVQGKGESSFTLVEAFQYHNNLLSSELSTDRYAPATLKRYETTLKHTVEYLNLNYNSNDIPLSNIKYDFITGFDHYFRVTKQCNNNTTVKYLRNFRKVINMAIRNEWMKKDPFLNFKTKIIETKREPLTEEEINKIEKLNISIPRLDLVRDIFVFCCYTGLSYVDVADLNADNIKIGIDGDLWLIIEREKTKVSAKVPLLEPAQQILRKYKDNPAAINQGRLLPVLSNQKTNAYLKEIADMAEISKNLTFHIARHSFATLALSNSDVTIETVSAMLGHRDIKTTQIYSKITEKKISDEMRAMKNKFSRRNSKDLNYSDVKDIG